jgi:hypothetical protein
MAFNYELEIFMQEVAMAYLKVGSRISFLFFFWKATKLVRIRERSPNTSRTHYSHTNLLAPAFCQPCNLAWKRKGVRSCHVVLQRTEPVCTPWSLSVG